MSLATDSYQFSVEGMSCVKCLQKVRDLSTSKFGAQSVAVNLDQGSVELKVGPLFEPDQYISSMKSLGFTARINKDKESNHSDRASKQMLARIGVAGACAGNIMLISFALYSGADVSEFFETLAWLSFALYLPILFYSAFPILKSSLLSIKAGKPSVDVPLSIAIVGGTFMSLVNLVSGSDQFYFDSLSIFVFLILSSRYFIYKLQQKHLRPLSIGNILGSEKVKLTTGETSQMISIDKLKPDDCIQIEQNLNVPTDCELLSPDFIEMNTATLSGESEPVVYCKGDRIPAGAQLYSTSAVFKVLVSVDKSHLSDLLAKVNEAVYEKTSYTLWADKMAYYFTFIILATVASVIVTHQFLPIENSFDRILALLVLSCPCALAIATPLTLSLAIKRAFREGLLIKRANAFEKCNRLKALLFDKTGTLTTERAKVLSWSPSEPDHHLKSLVANLERENQHPVAKALLENIGRFELKTVSNKKIIPGLGVEGFIDGLHVKVQKSNEKDRSMVEVVVDGKRQALAEIATEVRSEAEALIQELRPQFDTIEILTGDSRHESLKVAGLLGISEPNVHENFSPEQKADYVSRLQEQESVGFVGDGINDCLAMAKCDLSVSMGGSPEATFKSSDVHLLKNSLSQLKVFISISKQVERLIRDNLILSLGYNTIFGALAISGFINPFLAAVLMPISSVTVVSHTLFRMRSFK